jgi:hypothetical protein
MFFVSRQLRKEKEGLLEGGIDDRWTSLSSSH